MKSYEIACPNNWGLVAPPHSNRNFGNIFENEAFFRKKNLKNHDFEGSVEKIGGRDPKFFFIEFALLSAQTWWTTSKTCGASPERYEPIFSTLNQQNLNFHEKSWKFTTDFTDVFQKPQMKIFS